MQDTMLDLRSDLERARGHWPRIAADTAVDYFTIARIARGETANPRIDTVEKIRGWIDTNQHFLTAESSPTADPESQDAA